MVTMNRWHVVSGRRKNQCACPVALALKSAGVVKPSVAPTTILAEVDGDMVSMKTPKHISMFILRYDTAGTMERLCMAPAAPFSLNFVKV